MNIPTLRVVRRWAGSLAVLFSLLSGCSAYETSRVLSLDDVPTSKSVRRPSGEAPQPLFVETTGALVAKRQLRIGMSVEPSLESYLTEALETELDIAIEHLRVDFVGYRYAYYFPSRIDDFVVRIELDAPAAGIHGTFEGVVKGKEFHEVLIGRDWRDEIPNTASPEASEIDDTTRALERRADERAYFHRLLFKIAAERLARAIAAG